MIKRFATNGITYEKIIDTYKTKGLKETECLLKGEVDGKSKNNH